MLSICLGHLHLGQAICIPTFITTFHPFFIWQISSITVGEWSQELSLSLVQSAHNQATLWALNSFGAINCCSFIHWRHRHAQSRLWPIRMQLPDPMHHQWWPITLPLCPQTPGACRRSAGVSFKYWTVQFEQVRIITMALHNRHANQFRCVAMCALHLMPSIESDVCGPLTLVVIQLRESN